MTVVYCALHQNKNETDDNDSSDKIGIDWILSETTDNDVKK